MLFSTPPITEYPDAPHSSHNTPKILVLFSSSLSLQSRFMRRCPHALPAGLLSNALISLTNCLCLTSCRSVR